MSREKDNCDWQVRDTRTHGKETLINCYFVFLLSAHTDRHAVQMGEDEFHRWFTFREDDDNEDVRGRCLCRKLIFLHTDRLVDEFSQHSTRNGPTTNPFFSNLPLAKSLLKNSEEVIQLFFNKQLSWPIMNCLFSLVFESPSGGRGRRDTHWAVHSLARRDHSHWLRTEEEEEEEREEKKERRKRSEGKDESSHLFRHTHTAGNTSHRMITPSRWLL